MKTEDENEDLYAGDAAWQEWFDVCSVAGCSELEEHPKDGLVTMRFRVKDKRISLWANGQQMTYNWYVPPFEDPHYQEYVNLALLGEGVVVKRIRLRRVPVEVK